jgi:hypothetical protein
MKQGAVVFFFLLHILCLGQNKRANIVAMEKARFEAMVKKDTIFLKKILAPELVYTHSNALIENKEQFLSSIQTGKIVYESISQETQDIKVFGKAAVIHGVVKVTGQLNKNGFTVRLAYVDVYLKRKRKWQLVTWQSTKIP